MYRALVLTATITGIKKHFTITQKLFSQSESVIRSIWQSKQKNCQNKQEKHCHYHDYDCYHGHRAHLLYLGPIFQEKIHHSYVTAIHISRKAQAVWLQGLLNKCQVPESESDNEYGRKYVKIGNLIQ